MVFLKGDIEDFFDYTRKVLSDHVQISSTGGLEISYSGFSTISRCIERILMEHIELICSLESRLTFFSTCSIRIRSRNEDIVEKPVQLI